jgi:hypothetical protein
MPATAYSNFCASVGIVLVKSQLFYPLELRTYAWWRAGRIERLALREPGYSRPLGPPKLTCALRLIGTHTYLLRRFSSMKSCLAPVPGFEPGLSFDTD